MKNESNLNTKCLTGKSPSGHCGSAFYCSEPYDCCGQCPEKCNTGEKENFTETTGLRLCPQTVLQQRNIGKMAKEKNSINTEKNLPVATFSKEISKDFFSEKEEHYYFHLKDTVHEFAMGLKEILLCVHFAEDEGLIPKASYEWWSFLYSTYNVPHEPYSQNYKEGFHNGFWNAIELIKKQKNINTYIQKIEEKYSGLDSSEFLGAIDIEWEADSDIE